MTQAVAKPTRRPATYAEAGVTHVWHISPVLKMLEVYELRDGKWLLLDVFRDDANVAAVPFAELSFCAGPAMVARSCAT